jgi:hypothetical protein
MFMYLRKMNADVVETLSPILSEHYDVLRRAGRIAQSVNASNVT